MPETVQTHQKKEMVAEKEEEVTEEETIEEVGVEEEITKEMD